MKNNKKIQILCFVILLFVMGACKKDNETSLDLPPCIDANGKVYKTVKIGTQIWMAENLAYKPDSGNFWAYDNNQSYVAIYGYLYDWEIAKKICPTGWHLPSDGEWTQLIDYLGSYEVAGGKMKATSGWDIPNTGATNSSGFSALPGGFHRIDGSFDFVGHGCFWISTHDDVGDAYKRGIYWNHTGIYRYDTYQGEGYSVRCLLD